MMKNTDKRQRILIVDDAKLNRDILKEILGKLIIIWKLKMEIRQSR